MGIRLIRVVSMAVLALAACSTSSAPPASETAAPRPMRPDVPVGWQAMEAAGLRLTLPPDLARVEGMAGVAAQSTATPGAFSMEVHAARASDMQPPRPWTQEVVAEWLARQAPSMGDGLTVSETRMVELPAGRAVEIRGSFEVLRSEPVEVVAYAIPTESGIADLHILALASVAEERAEDIELIAQLWVLDP